MSRFKEDVEGLHGEVDRVFAEKDAQQIYNQAALEAVVERNGAIKWKSNGRYLMDDACEMLEYKGFPFSREATRKKREIQVTQEIAEYKARRKDQPLSGEELYEMRAAFGPGETIVNVITGETHQL